MSNQIIIESENDKYFIEAFIKNLNLKNVKIGIPICNINDYECLNGYTNLQNNLNEIKFDTINKLGIIIDADEAGISKRIKFINKALKSVCNDIEFENMNELKRSEELGVDIACFIMNIEGKGELETVLKTIKSKDSIYADCLNAWRDCLSQNGEIIKDKVFDKFWINNYLKFDTCDKKERKQIMKNCNNEIAMKKDIWKFDHPALEDLRCFLNLFKS